MTFQSKCFRTTAFPVISIGMILVLMLANDANATWRVIDNNKIVTSMDFLPTGVGLVGIGGPGPRIEIWDGKTIENGVYAATSGDIVTSVKLIDSSTAWATITNEGLYETTTKLWGLNSWKQVLGGTNLRLMYASKSILFIVDGKTLKFSTDLSTFTVANGILAGDTINAVDGDGQIYVATAGTHVYRSQGGASWSLTDSVVSARSVFYDGVVKAYFIGGDSVRKSIDFGLTWVPMISPVSDISGQVVGVYDCSGAFYVTTYISNIVSSQHNTILRSQDHGLTFQNVGRAYNSTIHFQEGRAFDRGTQLYWLDPVDGYLSVSDDGVDGSIPFPVAPQLEIKPDSPIISNECEHQVTPFQVALTYIECVALHVDSLKVLSSTGTVSFVSYKVNVSEGSPAVLQLNYLAHDAGTDSVQCQLWFHNTETAISESKVFAFVATGTTDPAKIATSTSALNFDDVKVDSQKTLTLLIRNEGCDPLQVDSVVSSNNALFALDQHVYPLTLKNGDSLKIKATFFPVTIGEQVEAIEYGSSAGHGFVELRGTGATTIVQGVNTVAANQQLGVYPNPVRDIVTLTSSEGFSEVSLTDVIGRTLFHSFFAHRTSTEIDMRALQVGVYFVQADRNRPIPILLIH